MPNRVDEAKWKSLRRIESQDRREITHAAKAGYLWKRGKSLKRWLRRWYIVKNGSLSYAYTPQEAAAYNSVRVFSLVRSVQPVQTPPLKHTTPEGKHLFMYGMLVESSEGDTVTVYASSEEQRESWVSMFQQASTAGKFVTDLYDVDINHPLGCGSFATVVKGVHREDRKQYAVKIISRSAFQECSDMLHREINILHMLGHHKHVVSLKEVLHAPLRIYMVFDFCDGGELVDKVTTVNPMGEKAASRIFRELVEALAFLHDQGVAHMDLKPENIVFQNRDKDSPIKVIDFSLATFFQQPTEPGGTPEFVAPEIVRDPHHIAECGVGGEVDMWAAGIILYFLLSGRTPFDDQSVQKILQNVMVGRWRWRGQHWNYVTGDAKDLIRKLLTIDPTKRMTARQALSHPWINGSLNLPEVPYLCTQEHYLKQTRNLPASHPSKSIIKPRQEATNQKAVKFVSPEKQQGQALNQQDTETQEPFIQGRTNGSRLQQVSFPEQHVPGSPETPRAGGSPQAVPMDVHSITPHKDVVQDRMETPPEGTPGRPSTGKKRQDTVYLTPHGMEVLNSIAQTRQNQRFSPRHSPKIGRSELHKCSNRHRMKNALLEAAKSPAKLEALRTPSRVREQEHSKRANAFPPDLRMSLFTNSPHNSPHKIPGSNGSSAQSLRGPSTPDAAEAPSVKA